MADNSRRRGDQELLIKLEHVGNSLYIIVPLFLLCLVPSILNGLNMTSYVYLTDVPEHWCHVTELDNSTWTLEEIRRISSPSGSNASSCSMYNFDYAYLSQLSFDDAWNLSRTYKADIVPCHSRSYDPNVPSMVRDFDLTCERTVYKPTIQMAMSIGKFLGAFLFGIVSDKYGRRTSFLCGCVLYIISGPIVAAAHVFSFVIIGRIGLGMAGSGIYHSAFVILTEIASPGRRASISIIYNMSYPIGQMIVPIVAYFVREWRTLQIIISAPALFILIFWWLLPESPMWLLSKNRREEAAKYINTQYNKLGTMDDVDLQTHFSLHEAEAVTADDTEHSKPHSSSEDWIRAVWLKLGQSFDQLYQLVRYGELRTRMAIAFFTWCVCSFAYYGLALNVDNFATDRYVYGFLTGLVEAPSYLLPLPLLKCMGRRYTAVVMFYVAGVALLLILALPTSTGLNVPLLVVASIGRLCVSGVFAVIILHTTEMFPTPLRNTAIGIGSTSSHIGSMSAPFFVDLIGAYSRNLPSTIFGILSLLAGSLVLLLPETKNRPLPNSVEDIVAGPRETKVGLHQWMVVMFGLYLGEIFNNIIY